MTAEKLTSLYSKEMIGKRVTALAEEISRDYPKGDVVLVGVLKGAFVFLADLIRELTISPSIDFIWLSSYGASTTSSGSVEILKDLETDITGKEVIIVEDIIDTGFTVKFLKEELATRQPHSLKVCVLLDKRFRRKVAIQPDYVGIAMDEDFFVIGYGLDCSERYRHLAGIYYIDS
jgi:hypoxanthine phosphoribosyltransferase